MMMYMAIKNCDCFIYWLFKQYVTSKKVPIDIVINRYRCSKYNNANNDYHRYNL